MPVPCPTRSPRRRGFVSYEHTHDEPYVDEFARVFGDTWKLVRVRRFPGAASDDDVYTMRRIREGSIRGSSFEMVFCGSHTHRRKFVDWEVATARASAKGLIGLILPTNRGKLPLRLRDNVRSGYALTVEWDELLADPCLLSRLVEESPGP